MSKKQKVGPYTRVQWRGVTLDARTASAMDWVAKRVKPLVTPTQGSFNTSVGPSAGTHAGSSAIDLSVRGWAPADIRQLVNVMRRAGFAAWYRAEIPGLWPPHVHAILIGGKMIAPAAQAQIVAYRAGRNGLANNAVDNTWRPRIPRRWNHRLKRPVLHPLPGQNLTPQQKKMLPEPR